MSALATVLKAHLQPDAARTVLRPFVIEDPLASASPRTQRVIEEVMALNPEQLAEELQVVATGLDDRHRNTEALLFSRYEDLKALVKGANPSNDQAKLIGAYFSEEFSFESTALFNPSVVRHPDQAGVAAGADRIIISLRGIGEGHISSLAFRTAVWEADGTVTLEEPSKYAVGPRIERSEAANGELIVHLYWDCDDVSEKVIYPFMPSQGRGIEDVRMVQFTDADGTVDYRATYTAFNGSDVRQGLMRSPDFKNCEMRGVQGDHYSGKGMALFPRKINGRYAMLGRQDNENIWLIYSDDFYTWNGGEVIVSPKYAWEFIQMGNCGSPIELDEGWLMLTHGVGVVRNYCVGAVLLDKNDPSKVLGRLDKPLLEPDAGSRDGYVPNVVYSCGAIVRDRVLLLPYGVADNFAAFATVKVDDLLAAMVKP
jgi:predicted GH43/DUF377 family glycosyl hydrolase